MPQSLEIFNNSVFFLPPFRDDFVRVRYNCSAKGLFKYNVLNYDPF